MRSPPNIVGKGVMFSGCPSSMFVCLFVWTNLVTMISHEQLEKSQ